MYENSSSKFFRTTAGMQSGPDAFDALHYDLLTNLGVPEILCSFRLVLEGKMSKEIPESSRLDFKTTLLYQMQKATTPGC